MRADLRLDFRWQDAAICGVLFTAALTYFCLSLRYSLELQDEGYFHLLSSLAAAGELPQRDFTDLYGPGVYWLNGLLLGVSGGQILAVRLGIAASKAAAVVLTYLLVRGLVSTPLAILGSIVAILFWGRSGWALNTPYAALYTVPLCMAACWVLIRALGRGSVLGLVASGGIAGCAVLFKHSLALQCIGGMGVAIWSVSLLEAPPHAGSRRQLAWGLVPLAAAAVAILAPFHSMLSLRDYGIHFAPFHLLLAVVIAACVRRRPELEPRSILTNRIAPFALGVSLAPAVVAVVYLSRGALGALLHQLFVVPMQMQNYYYPVRTPPWDSSVVALGALAVLTAGLLALRGLRRASWGVAISGLAAVGLAVVSHDYGDVPRMMSGVRWLGPAFFDEILGPATVLAAGLALVPLALTRSPHDQRSLSATLPLLFLGSMVLLQAFPRASFSTWTVEAASVPVLVWVLSRWRAIGVPVATDEAAYGFRRAAATLLVLPLPLWMSSHASRENAPIRQLGVERRALDLPQTNGIALSPDEIRIRNIVSLEALVRHLGETKAEEGPVLLLGNAWMTAFLSGRPMLFPERSGALMLMALGMLPDEGIADLDESAMLERMRRTPNVVVIDDRGPGSKRMRAALPRLKAYVDRELTSRRRFGPFQILRRPRR